MGLKKKKKSMVHSYKHRIFIFSLGIKKKIVNQRQYNCVLRVDKSKQVSWLIKITHIQFFKQFEYKKIKKILKSHKMSQLLTDYKW